MRGLLISGTIALALSLAGCDGKPNDRPPAAASSASSAMASLLPSDSIAEPADDPASSANATPSASPKGSAKADGEPASSASVVSTPAKSGADPAKSDAGKNASSKDNGAPFDPEYPALRGIKLGMDAADVRTALGASSQHYDLPDPEGSILMNEYKFLTVGTDSDGHVVYAEVSASGTTTGIAGLAIGTAGDAAAMAIGVSYGPDVQVLLRQVAGGILKIDLDPVTRQVLSVKLVARS